MTVVHFFENPGGQLSGLRYVRRTPFNNYISQTPHFE